jgi:hypothetical protein
MTSVIPGIFVTARSTINQSNLFPDRLELMASSTQLWPLQLSLKYSVSDYQWKRPGLELSLSLDLDPARLHMVSSYLDDQFVSNAMIEGSVSVSAAGVQMARTASLGQSAIVVMAFHDLNRNGVRDGNDTTLGTTAAVLHRSNSETTRNDGAFYNLIADNLYQIEVDRWSHAGDGLYPRRREFPIYTLPSTVHVIQVPFTEGFEVSGTCRMESAVTAGGTSTGIFNGLRIKLASDTPDALYTGEVFSDGTILISGVAPGEYRIEFDRRQLQSRGLQVAGLPERVTLNEEKTSIPDISFRLVRR